MVIWIRTIEPKTSVPGVLNRPVGFIIFGTEFTKATMPRPRVWNRRYKDVVAGALVSKCLSLKAVQDMYPTLQEQDLLVWVRGLLGEKCLVDGVLVTQSVYEIMGLTPPIEKDEPAKKSSEEDLVFGALRLTYRRLLLRRKLTLFLTQSEYVFMRLLLEARGRPLCYEDYCFKAYPKGKAPRETSFIKIGYRMQRNCKKYLKATVVLHVPGSGFMVASHGAPDPEQVLEQRI